MKTRTLLALLIICTASSVAVAQEAQEVGNSAVVIKFRWDKERIRPRPSMAPLASYDELVQQSRREQQLAAARNASNKPLEAKLETQISNHQNATTKAQQTELPRDGYRYKATLRNDGLKTIKSVDWDYLFLDPETQQELARHKFTSDETIKPGKSKEVSVLYLVPPVKTLDVRSLRKKEPASVSEQVVIAGLKYSDGSVWQRP